MKTCTKCGVAKPLDEFHPDKRSGSRRARCRSCVNAVRGAHRAANRNAEAARQRAYRRANAAAIAEYNRAYHQANRDALAERKHAYNQANPHVHWESLYRRRVRRYGFTPVVVTFTRADVIARYGDRCWHCGGDFDELDHHPIAVRDGGPHTLDNVRPSCTACNKRTWKAGAA